MSMDFKRGGQAIQRIRKERGMTQEDLADKSGITSNTVSRIEPIELLCQGGPANRRISGDVGSQDGIGTSPKRIADVDEGRKRRNQ